MKKIIVLLLVFCGANIILAQKSTDLHERALNGKIKTIQHFDYNKENAVIVNGKVKDSTKWNRKIIYHYDSIGNLDLK